MVTFSAELKKGGMEMLVLALLEARPRHGYEIAKAIEARSDGQIRFALASVYPTLLRLEKRGVIKGRWVEKAGARARCYYRLTPHGRKLLVEQQATWKAYVAAMSRVMEPDHA